MIRFVLRTPYDGTGSADDESLLALLAAAARRRSDGALALWAGGGGAAALVIGALLPGWWSSLLAAISAAAFGGWGIVDRELMEMSPDVAGQARRRRMLRAARTTLAVLGLAAAVLSLLAFFLIALGTWIS